MESGPPDEPITDWMAEHAPLEVREMPEGQMSLYEWAGRTMDELVMYAVDVREFWAEAQWQDSYEALQMCVSSATGLTQAYPRVAPVRFAGTPRPSDLEEQAVVGLKRKSLSGDREGAFQELMLVLTTAEETMGFFRFDGTTGDCAPPPNDEVAWRADPSYQATPAAAGELSTCPDAESGCQDRTEVEVGDTASSGSATPDSAAISALSHIRRSNGSLPDPERVKKLAGADPRSAIGFLRSQCERLVRSALRRNALSDDARGLGDAVTALYESGTIDRVTKWHFDSLRTLGNISVHEPDQPVGRDEVDIALRCFVRIVSALMAGGLIAPDAN